VRIDRTLEARKELNLLESIVQESVQSDREIRWLADDILTLLSRRVVRKPNATEQLALGVPIGQVKGSRDYAVIADWLDSEESDVRVVTQFPAILGTQAGTRGVYVKKMNTILVKIPDRTLKGVNEYAQEKDVKGVNSMLMALKDIVVHELQHAFDDFRSKGKYLGKSYTNDPDKKEYWLHPAEITARFAGTAKNLEYMKLQLYKDDGFLGKGLRDYIETFKHQIDAWKDMPVDVQRRLIGRMTQEFMDLSNWEKDGMLASAIGMALYNIADYDTLSLSGIDVSQDPRLSGDKAFSGKNQIALIKALIKDAIHNPDKYKKAAPWSNITDGLNSVQLMLRNDQRTDEEKQRTKLNVSREFDLDERDWRAFLDNEF
jgi:hypothetical protein